LFGGQNLNSGKIQFSMFKVSNVVGHNPLRIASYGKLKKVVVYFMVCY